MAQTLLLKGVGVFATLIGIYTWVVAEAEPQDVFFIFIVAVLLTLMDKDAEKQEHVAESRENQPHLERSIFPETNLTKANINA